MNEKATDSEFLNWLADRLVHVYGENPDVDFVHTTRSIAAALASPQVAPELTDQQIMAVAYKHDPQFDDYHEGTSMDAVIEIVREAVALSATPAPAPAAPQDDARDAARWRWLMDSEWEMFESYWLNLAGLYGEGPKEFGEFIDAQTPLTLPPSTPAAKPTEEQ